MIFYIEIFLTLLFFGLFFWLRYVGKQEQAKRKCVTFIDMDTGERVSKCEDE